MADKNPLEDALNIEPTKEEKLPLRKQVEVDLSNFPDKKLFDQKSDYGQVRGNLKDVIDNSKVAIEGILRVASETDSPRAYEVVSQLLKTATEANKDLIDLHKQMKDLEKDDTIKKVTNNAFFVGSTKELQELVQQQLPAKKVKKIRNDREA